MFVYSLECDEREGFIRVINSIRQGDWGWVGLGWVTTFWSMSVQARIASAQSIPTRGKIVNRDGGGE